MSDIVTTQIFSNGETGITATKMNNIVGQASIQTDFVASKPLASSVAANDQLLLLTASGPYARTNFSTLTSAMSGSLVPAGVGQAGIMNALSGKTTDYVGGDNACHDIGTAVQPTIWSQTRRVFNSVGNPNFEVTQRNCGTGVGNPAQTTFIEDRWSADNNALNIGFQVVPAVFGNQIVLPGTNYAISRSLMRTTVGTVKTTLAAADRVGFTQQIEGPAFRELCNDVHSISILARSTVANLQFGLALRDPGTTRSLTKLCSLGAASTWTLITLPNLPLWPSAGSFSIAPGALGYFLTFCFAAGSTYMSLANDTWQTGNLVGAAGQSNLLSYTTSDYVDIAFVQHEPGALCTTLIDKPFSQNYDECLRYFAKSYDLDVKPGTASTNNYATFNFPYSVAGAFSAYGGTRFRKALARLPTTTIYNHGSGASGTCQGYYASGSYGASPTVGVFTVSSTASTKTGLQSINSSVTSPGPIMMWAEWTADTNW